MEINIRIEPKDLEKVSKLTQVNQDAEFLAGVFCDNYCKYPD